MSLHALKRRPATDSPAFKLAHGVALAALDELADHRDALASLAAAVEGAEPIDEPLAAAKRLLATPSRVRDFRPRRTTGVVQGREEAP